jgi:hypothetical protein
LVEMRKSTRGRRFYAPDYASSCLDLTHRSGSSAEELVLVGRLARSLRARLPELVPAVGDGSQPVAEGRSERRISPRREGRSAARDGGVAAPPARATLTEVESRERRLRTRELARTRRRGGRTVGEEGGLRLRGTDWRRSRRGGGRATAGGRVCSRGRGICAREGGAAARDGLAAAPPGRYHGEPRRLAHT